MRPITAAHPHPHPLLQISQIISRVQPGEKFVFVVPTPVITHTAISMKWEAISFDPYLKSAYTLFRLNLKEKEEAKVNIYSSVDG